ncbi:MAG: energy transducer TonB [Pseudomonadota bacterium]
MRYLAVLLACVAISIFGHSSAQDSALADIENAKLSYDANPSGKNRKALLQALANYDGPPRNETVLAYVAVLDADGQGTQYDKIYESASATATHLESVANILPRQYLEARFIAATASFNGTQDSNAMLEMAHVQGLASHQRDETQRPPDWAQTIRYNAEAWRMAMETYYTSNNVRNIPTQQVDLILSEYRLSLPYTAPPDVAVAESDLPHCDGTFVQKPAMKYSRRKANKGMFGALLVEFEFDAEGKVANPVILASVPARNFDDDVLRTIKKWTFKAAGDETPGVTCRLNRSNVIQPFSFYLK